MAFLVFPQLMRIRAGQHQISECFKLAFRPLPPVYSSPSTETTSGRGAITTSPNQQPQPRQETEEVD